MALHSRLIRYRPTTAGQKRRYGEKPDIFITHALGAAGALVHRDGIVVPAGTDVKLRFIEGLSSGKVHVGDPITLELAEDLTVALSAAWLAAAALSGWSTAARPMNALPAATGTARNA